MAAVEIDIDVCLYRLSTNPLCYYLNYIRQAIILVHRTEEVQQGQKVAISRSRVPILLYGNTGFATVPQLFCNESVLYMFFAVSNTSLSTVPFMNDFLGYDLDDLFDLGQ